MSTTLHSLIEAFSDKDQKRIQRKASVLAEEMIRHADSLAEVRTALVKTQDAKWPASSTSNKMPWLSWRVSAWQSRLEPELHANDRSNHPNDPCIAQ